MNTIIQTSILAVINFRLQNTIPLILLLITAYAIGKSSAACPGPPDCFICSPSQAVCKLCPEDQNIPETITDLKLIAGGCRTLQTLGLLRSTSFSRYPNLERLTLNHVHVMRFFGSVFYANSKLRILSMAQNEIRSFGSTVFKGLGRLEELNLASSQIRALIAASFKELTGLKDLNLAGNLLTELTEHDFDGLQSLQGLHLSLNPIATAEPNVFQNLRNIETIDLAQSQLQIVPNELFGNLASLKNVDLSGNNITIVEPGSMTGTSLNILNLSNNRLLAVPSSAIKMTTHVPKTIDLSNNTVSRIANNEASALDVDTLDLHDNPITVIEPRAFSGSKIKNLDLRGTLLRSLPSTLESVLTNSKTNLNLEGLKSWQCDCAVLWLGRYLQSSPTSKSPTCGGNINKYSGRTLTDVMPVLEADCKTTTSTTTTTTTTTTTITTTETPSTTTKSTASTKLTSPSKPITRPSRATIKHRTRTTPTHLTSAGSTKSQGLGHSRSQETTIPTTRHSSANNNENNEEDENADDTVKSILVVLIILCLLAFCLTVLGVIAACIVCKRHGYVVDSREDHNIPPAATPMTIGWKGRMEAIHTF